MPKASSLFLSKALEGFALYKRSEGISPRTIELHLHTLRKFVAQAGDRPIEGYTTHDLRAFLAAASDHYASATVRRYWTSLRSFWRWVNEELGLPNIAKPIKAPAEASRPVHALTEDEIRKLIAATEYTASANTERRTAFRMKRSEWRRDRAILLLLLDTGIRASELCRLTIGDVDLETGEIVILPSGSGKKSRPRVIPIGRRTRRALWDYLARRSDIQEDPDPDTLPLFLGRTGRALDRVALRKLLHRLGERAGVPNVYPHRLRHTFAIVTAATSSPFNASWGIAPSTWCAATSTWRKMTCAASTAPPHLLTAGGFNILSASAMRRSRFSTLIFLHS